MATPQVVFDEMSKRLTKDKAKKINASYLFDIAGEKWLVDLTKEDGWVQKSDGDAQCTITIKESDDWVKLATGKLNPTMAFMQGKIRVKGDMSLALKLQSLLS
ncbi:MAG: SCP2 sterol-binding domain-containing protein [Myxococcales bacterium]|nr:SCP2 sterol-binding domain-containing protein [Myxococcales bacterium]USN50601.1 MAG: SCP2 sterol-binding domain-containing protein [Myxococcales bacterium]